MAMRRSRIAPLLVLAAGAIFGYPAATGGVNSAAARPDDKKGAEAAPPPGSPGATLAIDGRQLPPPDPKFGGKIEKTADKSTPYWPPRVAPKKGAPNVLLIMTDDSGFGVTSPFGG